jgi:hypothetical protein
VFPFDARFKYVLKGRMWERRWRDWRFLAAQATGPRYRIELMGLSGIGKSYFTQHVVRALGEKVPVLLPPRELSPEWVEALEQIIDHRINTLRDSELGGKKKLDIMTDFTTNVNFDIKIMRRYYGQVIVNSESLLRSNSDFFRKAAESRGAHVQTLLQDRVVIFCTSDDPVSRALQGRRKRGDRHTPHADIDDVRERSEKLEEAVARLAGLAIPVLTINLDAPVRDNVQTVTRFLHHNGVTSRAISHLARA